MAESVKRRETMLKAWREWNVDESASFACFDAGFNAAWDALLSEIRPLVEYLGHVAVTHHLPLATMREEGHNMAIERLRELVREGE